MVNGKREYMRVRAYTWTYIVPNHKIYNLKDVGTLSDQEWIRVYFYCK